jgi:long-chain acyl-CoA synthetase
MGMQQGAQNVLIPNPRDIPAFVKELNKYPIHIFPGLNTLFNALLNNEDFRKLDFKPLILTLGGGMAVQKGVAERWKALTGCPVTEGYGLSETSPVATANKFTTGEFTGSIGLPLPSTEIAIRDDDGNNLPPGEVGEVCIRGPQVMAGYWNRPDETAKVMTKDGFFKSGDMTGPPRLHQDRRPQEDSPVSGFNVYPTNSRKSWPSIRAFRSGGDQRAGRAFRRGAEAVRRQEGPDTDRRSSDCLLPREPDRLQAAQI